MELTDQIKKEIKEHCLSDVENECCGLILSNGKVIPCENRASDSDVHFIINSWDIKKAKEEGWVSATYHSHVKVKEDEEDKLSNDDKIISEYFNIEFVLYSIKNDEFCTYQPTGKPIEYVGRPYIRHVLDETHLIRDYYKRELNIEIKVKNRNKEGFLKENGFGEENGGKKGDILLINWAGDKNDKRLGIYVGGDKILVQPEFEQSKIVDYNYGLKNWTAKMFRHNKLI